MILGRVRYQAAVNGVDVTSRLLEWTWEHTTRELAERASIEIALHPTRDDRLFAAVGTGAALALWADGVGVFQGRIESSEFTEKRSVTLTLTAYASAFNWGANEEDVAFAENYTTQDVTDLVFGTWGMPMGRNDWPTMSLGGAETYRQKTLAYIVEDTNRKLRLLGAGDYFVRSAGNGIEIIRGGTGGGSVYVFTPNNTMVMVDQQSTQDLVTQVRFASSQVDDEGNKQIAAPQVITNPRATPALYGIRQRIVTDNVTQGTEQSAAEAIFEQTGEPQRVYVFEAPDVPQIRKGDAVEFRVGTVSRQLILTGVHHDGRTGVVRMEVDTTGKSKHRASTKREQPTVPDRPDLDMEPLPATPEGGGPAAPEPPPIQPLP